MIDQARGEIFVVADELIEGKPAHRLAGLSIASGRVDAVLELTPSLRLVQFFAPGTWATDNSRDLDMSVAPVLLPDGQVLLTGKARIVLLLNGARLGGIDHQQAVLRWVTASPPALHLLWSSGTGGGPPIVVAGLVWTIGQDGVPYGLDPATGKVRQQVTIGVPANHFPTPSAGDGLLLAAGADNVVAFAAPAPGAAAATVPGATAGRHVSCLAYSAPAGPAHIPRRYLAAIAFGAAAALIGLGWLASRRLRRAR